MRDGSPFSADEQAELAACQEAMDYANKVMWGTEPCQGGESIGALRADIRDILARHKVDQGQYQLVARYLRNRTLIMGLTEKGIQDAARDIVRLVKDFPDGR